MTCWLLRFKAWMMRIVARFHGLMYCGPDPGYEATVKQLDTPWKINCWLQANMTYVKDRVDYWNNPIETYRARRGDCDDYARFAVHCLNRHGYPAFFLLMYEPGRGHATAFYDDFGSACTIGTFGLVKHLTSDLDQVTSFFFGHPVDYELFDENLTRV